MRLDMGSEHPEFDGDREAGYLSVLASAHCTNGSISNAGAYDRGNRKPTSYRRLGWNGAVYISKVLSTPSPILRWGRFGL